MKYLVELMLKIDRDKKERLKSLCANLENKTLIRQTKNTSTTNALGYDA